eukprot:scaffold26083_cov76-Amphora_coffeaeformis.AAC.1
MNKWVNLSLNESLLGEWRSLTKRRQQKKVMLPILFVVGFVAWFSQRALVLPSLVRSNLSATGM